MGAPGSHADDSPSCHSNVSEVRTEKVCCSLPRNDASGNFYHVFGTGPREVLRLRDGGHLCLDWYNERSPEQPTVLMLPGITGTYDCELLDVNEHHVFIGNCHKLASTWPLADFSAFLH